MGIALGCVFLPNSVFSQKRSAPISKKKVSFPKKIKPTINKKLAWVVIDAGTGEVLSEYKSKEKRYPASITKTMTAYLILEQIRKKKLKFTDRLLVSKNASSKCRLKLYLKPGSKILLKDALLGALVHSANDASAVLAEAISKTESQFSLLMTKKAKQLGLTRTQFRNATGLPDKTQVTCALDLAKLCQALVRDFPEYYHYFSVQKFTYRGTTYKNANKLLGTVPGVDGIKTGYTPIAGFHLAASAKRGNTRLIAVVMGTRSPHERNHKTASVLEEGFRIAKERAYTKSLAQKKKSPQQPPSKPSEKPTSLPTEELDIDDLLKEEFFSPHSTLDPSATLDQELTQFLKPVPQETALAPSQGAASKIIPPLKPSSLQKPSLPQLPPRKPTPSSSSTTHRWAIQVGAFTQEPPCHQHLTSIKAQFSKVLHKATSKVVGPVGPRRKKFFLSRFINLSQKDALHICQTLSQASKECLVVPPPTASATPSRPPAKPKRLPRKPS